MHCTLYLIAHLTPYFISLFVSYFILTIFVYIYTLSCFCFIVFYCFYVIFILLSCFIFLSCTFHWADLSWLTFHYLLYPVWLCMWQIIKNLEPLITWSALMAAVGCSVQFGAKRVSRFLALLSNAGSKTPTLLWKQDRKAHLCLNVYTVIWKSISSPQLPQISSDKNTYKENL